MDQPGYSNGGYCIASNKDGESAFVCPHHLFTNNFSNGDYVHCTSTTTTTTMSGPNSSEALPEGVSWETGSNRNWSNATAT